MLSSMSWNWQRRAGPLYLPLAGSSRSPSPSPKARSSSDSCDSYNGKEFYVASPPPRAAGHSSTRFRLLRSLVTVAIMLAVLGFAIFGIGMLVAIKGGKLIILPHYTTYDVGLAGWNRPHLSLAQADREPSSTIRSGTTKGLTATTVHDFDNTPNNATNASTTAQGVNDQHVLILSPLKNAEKVLPHFFALLDNMTHPKENTSIGFLLGDEEDATGSMVVDWVAEQRDKGEYRHITLLRKDFRMHSPGRNGRHQNWVQAQRRSLMGKARTLLLTNTLNPTVDWVLWLDSDVADFPSSIVSDLLLYGNAGFDSPSAREAEEPLADVFVPNVMFRPEGPGSIYGYDLNSWSETSTSMAMKAQLHPDLILHEGDRNLPTHRKHLARNWVAPNVSASWDATSPFWPLDASNSSHPSSDLYDPASAAYIGRRIDLDAVGGVATLVRAQTHMYGAVFPSWAEDHQVETEGFGVLAKKVGARIVGLPNYLVWHS